MDHLNHRSSMPYQVKSTGRWAAQGRIDGVRVQLGTFDTREDAVEAEARRERRPRDLFWPRVLKLTTGPVREGVTTRCWVWGGPTNGKGYGRFGGGATQVQAHCHSYEVHVGPIPEGHIVHHRCENTLCVNPDHLNTTTQGHHMAWHAFQRRRAALLDAARTVAAIGRPGGLSRATAQVDLVASGV